MALGSVSGDVSLLVRHAGVSRILAWLGLRSTQQRPARLTVYINQQSFSPHSPTSPIELLQAIVWRVGRPLGRHRVRRIRALYTAPGGRHAHEPLRLQRRRRRRLAAPIHRGGPLGRQALQHRHLLLRWRRPPPLPRRMPLPSRGRLHLRLQVWILQDGLKKLLCGRESRLRNSGARCGCGPHTSSSGL